MDAKIELENLKSTWATVEAKLDRNWKLNLKVIREGNLEKVRDKMKNLLRVKVITFTFYLIGGLCFAGFGIQHAAQWYMALTGGVFTLWAVLVCFTSVKEIELIMKLDYTAPVIELQRQLVTLRTTIIRYFRVGVWVFPLYMGWVIMAFQVFFGVDIIAVADQTWLYSQLGFTIVFMFPLALWMHSKLIPENADKKWMQRLLQGNGSQVAGAQAFLGEIREFEEEEQ
ncbi:hypothetical protein SAMN04488028_102618 [Reichenbachiella agariperforans]|uniref:Uncharacterized protein n=1 Tax=Reichenbachiella agariperforans TaxID=156994 RepID=A0A1M6PAL7_REIAG|nr:hypothetical protein [Reichenbachiella agariperforans]SHK04986.1 hypothetical protein SAMN04488028_102618 [Reichenbachiella agariperforans]